MLNGEEFTIENELVWKDNIEGQTSIIAKSLVTMGKKMHRFY